jgi:curved DNA-binding protein CbpA
VFLFDEVKKSHYEVLGISENATDAEIKKAYFNLVRNYQPDRSPEKFKEIRAAYETLLDGEKRAEYDAIGKLPSSVAPLFREAKHLDRFGKHGKAAELYQIILKSHPELDNVREEYASSLSVNNKPGKAAEVWEELCHRHPDNPRYARNLGECYFDRGWQKKAIVEVRRSLKLDRSSIEAWSLLISSTVQNLKDSPKMWNELVALTTEALEAVKKVKTNEWEKIYLLTYAFFAAGSGKNGQARKHLQEIVRIIREGGHKSQDNGRHALKQILTMLPPSILEEFYPELKEMADLIPDLPESIRENLSSVKLASTIEGLVEKNYHEIFCDLFDLLNSDSRDEEDELEITAIEFHLLDDKKTFDPQIRRLKEEFPELYAMHRSFFDTALRTRDPEKMLFQRSKKYNKLKRLINFDDDEDPDSEPPETVRRAQPKVGRNDPCPCGSGKKYKHCCGA